MTRTDGTAEHAPSEPDGKTRRRRLAVFSPDWFDSSDALVASLWRSGLTAVADVDGCLDATQRDRLSLFGLTVVDLSPLSGDSLRRLGVGVRRFAVAVATRDPASTRSRVGVHPALSRIEVEELRPHRAE